MLLIQNLKVIIYINIKEINIQIFLTEVFSLNSKLEDIVASFLFKK